MKGSLGRVEATLICKNCVNGNVEAWRVNKENVKNIVDRVEIVKNFCYLGDLIQKDGGCDKAVRDRVWKGWLKFKELSGVLCNRRIAMRMRGVLYRACVRTVMMYGLRAVAMKKEMRRLW